MKTEKKIGIALSLILGATAALSLAACNSNDGEYTVTFDTRGGSSIASLHLDEGETVARPSAIPEKELFTFDNWYADEKCTELFEFGSAMPAYDITVYAGWTAQIGVKVTFDANGGTFDVGGAVYKVGSVGQALTLPDAPARTGYAFGGWYTDPNCTSVYDFSVFPAENATLYAGWDKDAAYAYIEYYGNGKLLEVEPVKKGETVEEPELFGAGIVQSAWYTNENRADIYDFGDNVTGDLKLYCSYYTKGLQITDGVVTAYRGSAADVVVPDIYEGDEVVEIGEYAFYSSSETSSIVTVDLPATVERIARGAFYECTYLAEVDLSDSVTEIGEYAFYRNTRLRSVGDISSVTEIAAYAFLGCANLRAVSLSDELTSIGEFAFANCAALTEITVPEQVVALSDDTFGGCTSLKKVVLEATMLDTVGRYAFRDCAALDTVVIKSVMLPRFTGGNDESPFADVDCTIYVGSAELFEQFKTVYGYLDGETFGDKLAVIENG